MKEKVYTGFLFLPSMKKSMDELPPEKAKELAMAIIQYGTTGIFTSNDFVIKAVMQGIMPTIDSSIHKYANNCEDGNHGGAKPKYDTEKIISLYLAGMPREEIAAEMGCHPNTVGSRIRDYNRSHPEIDTTTTNNDTTIQQEYNDNQDKDKDKANDKDEKIKDEDKANDKDEDKRVPIEKESDSLVSLVSLLSDVCDFSNTSKINSIVANKKTKSITTDFLLGCLKENYEEIYNIVEDKKADNDFKNNFDSIYYVMAILANKIKDGWKPKKSESIRDNFSNSGYNPVQDCSSICENNFDCGDSEYESELPF